MLIRRLKPHRRTIVLGLILLAVTDVLGLAPPWLVKGAIDAMPKLSAKSGLLFYVVLLMTAVILQAFFRFGWRKALFGVSRNVEYGIRNDLFDHLLRMDRSFYLQYTTGELMSRCTNDLVAVQEFIAFFGLLVVDSTLTISTCLFLMAVIDPVMTLFVMIPMPFLSLSFLYFGRKVRKTAAQVQMEAAKLTENVQETLAGIRVIKAYTMEKVRRSQYGRATERYIQANLDLAAIRGVFFAALTFFTGLSAVIALWVGGQRVMNGHITLGGFVAFNTYLTMLIWPMMSLGFMVNLFQRGRASLDRIETVLARESKIKDAPGILPTGRPHGGIRFRNVRFRYPGAHKWALDDISFDIEPGTRVGITGPVGSGKSALLDLIPRIWDPTEGSIELDGRDLRSYPLKDLRRWVARVAQEPLLFSDTIASNIRFQPSDEPFGLETKDAAAMVRLDKDKDAFPKGWDTLVGERGIMVSGGQRQRIALARAVTSDPQILLLDDAFAHLDEETEAEVFENILEAMPGVVILFSSHRISSLLRADTVIVLDEGALAEFGPPEDRLHAGGYFDKLRSDRQTRLELEMLSQESSPPEVSQRGISK